MNLIKNPVNAAGIMLELYVPAIAALQGSLRSVLVDIFVSKKQKLVATGPKDN